MEGDGTCDGGSVIGVLGNDMRVLSISVPLIIGVLLGAPLAAHEMETGTTRFTWTQGITRSRWLLVKAGWLLLAAAICAGAVSALVTFWSGPVNAMRGDQFSGAFFDTQGVAPVGYAVFVTALGIAAGALLRRTLPAIAVTIAGFAGIRLLIVDAVRPHLMPAVTSITGLVQGPTSPGITWFLSSGIIGPSGQPLSLVKDGVGVGVDGLPIPLSAMPAACQKLAPAAITAGPPAKGAPDPVAALTSCLSHAGFRQSITYQPGWRYWPFQGIEAGIYLLLAAALVAVAWYAIRRRDA
jgi:hypothetical protein